MKFRITNENIEGYNTELKIRRMNYDQVVVNYQNNSGIKTFKMNEGELVSEGEVDDIIKKYTDLLKIKINFLKQTLKFLFFFNSFPLSQTYISLASKFNTAI